MEGTKKDFPASRSKGLLSDPSWVRRSGLTAFPSPSPASHPPQFFGVE
jgi:hypothetical protein